MYRLDFGQLPDLSHGSIIRRIDADLEQPLSRLPQTRARAEGAIRFSHDMDSRDHTLPVRESYLRAALAEFVSMEETLPRDIAASGIVGAARRSSESANPLLHMMRELRNLEIHLRSSRLSVSKTMAKYEDIESESGWSEIQLDAWWVDPITSQEFNTLRNARNYKPTDVDEMLEWFNQAQKVWGVDELVRLAVNGFAREVVLSLRLM